MVSNLIDSRKFRAALAARGERQYRLAVALDVAPAKLSALLHGHLGEAESTALRGRIEAHLGLAPGTLAVDEDDMRAG